MAPDESHLINVDSEDVALKLLRHHGYNLVQGIGNRPGQPGRAPGQKQAHCHKGQKILQTSICNSMSAIKQTSH